ncbi:hypothetical protein OH460_08610 [Vibrio sp. Makdt]|uniref:hypothetical protein n=1 Tax=Vibrio sp. Makdt TaxID=2998828 RepID=UPI0022CD7AEB|nr:hypothetical protein [Vibrio sp. Makdt]MDA0152362.1 hypothetical protein [Vibrio sp. Makdt]
MTDRKSSFEWVRINAYQSQIIPPRFMRKLMGRSPIHRAWLQGVTGSFLVPVLERK